MSEVRLLECLEAGLKAGEIAEDRLRRVTNHPSWELLEKSWKGLLLVALKKEKPMDGEMEHSVNLPRIRGGSRRRRNNRRSLNKQDLMPDVTIFLDSDVESAPFRLAGLLIHKSRNRETWNNSHDDVIEELREFCETGIHPVWGKLAEQTPLFAEFVRFPVSDNLSIEITDNLKKWVNSAKIDPNDLNQLTDFLSIQIPDIISSQLEVDLRRLVSQLKRRKQNQGSSWLRKIVPKSLLNMKGRASLISLILSISTNSKSIDVDLDEMEGTIKEVARLQLMLLDLKSGEVSDWNKARLLNGKDGLSRALRTEAWRQSPAELTNLTLKEIDEAIDLLNTSENNSDAIARLRWCRVDTLEKEGSFDVAIQELLELEITHRHSLDIALRLFESQSDDDLVNWIEGLLTKMTGNDLLSIIHTNNFSTNLRYKAVLRLERVDTELWKSIIPETIKLLVESADSKRLTLLLSSLENGAEKYPFETLAAAHLLPANSEQKLIDWVQSQRKIALLHVKNAEVNTSLSPLNITLLRILDGSYADSEPISTTLKDKSGFKAFKECRSALIEGGDGLVSQASLSRLNESITNAQLTNLERQLFTNLVNTLLFNRASFLIQRPTEMEEGKQLLNQLIEDPNTKFAFIRASRSLVLAHDISLVSLVEWYKINNPTSWWHSLVRGAVLAEQNDLLNAARSYRQAADNSDLEYQSKMMIYRKSLIHFAHAEQWSEAIELLEREQALKSVLSRNFQLYLRVSDDAARGQLNAATKRLKDYVAEDYTELIENQDGQLSENTSTIYSEENLDLLYIYPTEHIVSLPLQPFQGRVSAALSSINTSDNFSRRDYDLQYRRWEQEESLESTQELAINSLYEIAKQAAESYPVQGLQILERAINNGDFQASSIKRIREIQQALFQTYHRKIPVMKRRQLSSLDLRSLIIVDTNLLVDALQERISKQLDIARDIRLDLVEHRYFHRVLLHCKQEGKVRIYLPDIVKQELYNISQNIERIKRMFEDVFIEDERWDSIITKENLKKLVDQLISDFEDWFPTDPRLVESAEIQQESVTKFLVEHSDVYEELTQHKSEHKGLKRSSLDMNNAIFPEEGDLEVMRIAAHLATDFLPGINCILVASRDGDFTLVSRSIEETFGFGIVKSAQQLNLRLN